MTDQTSATVVADSVFDSSRLVTFHLTFPRIILAEFNTHRAFSRNSASSRAIPVMRQIELIRGNPFIPSEWPRNARGMSANGKTLGEADSHVVKKVWLHALEDACSNAELMADYGVHKQIVNRLLEPFMWHTVICSTTMPGLDNFFAQRDHPDAQPEMQILARKMREALEESKPEERSWHIPFTPEPLEAWNREGAMIIGISRCARVSYGRELEERTYEQDFDLVCRLARKRHESPLEHVSVADGSRKAKGNFGDPWHQVRHNLAEFLPSVAAALEADKM